VIETEMGWGRRRGSFKEGLESLDGTDMKNVWEGLLLVVLTWRKDWLAIDF
jgi:hypothetical protein